MTRMKVSGAIIATTIILVVGWLFQYSLRQPFIPSRFAEILFLRALPCALFISIVMIFLLKKVHGKRLLLAMIEASKLRKQSPQLLVALLVLFIAGASLTLGMISERLLAWPTYYFALRKTDLTLSVVDKSSMGHTLGRWSWITVQSNSVARAKFVWKTSDPNIANLKLGDRLNIRGREWLFGEYIESLEVVS